MAGLSAASGPTSRGIRWPIGRRGHWFAVPLEQITHRH